MLRRWLHKEKRGKRDPQKTKGRDDHEEFNDASIAGRGAGVCAWGV